MADKTFVKDVSDDFTGTAHLYRLSEPIGYDWDWEKKEWEGKTEYVVASATTVFYSGPETYLFPADENGKVLAWGELAGSFQGSLDCEKAINNLVKLITDGEYGEDHG